MADPTMPYPWRVPSERRIQKGDLILNELSMSYSGCSGQLIRPIAVGKPTQRFQKMYDLAEDVFRRVAGVIRPGGSKADVLKISAAIPEAGYTIEAPIIHGWDDKAESPHWGIPGRDVAGHIVEDERLQENQLIMIEPNPCTPDYRAGIFLGDVGVVKKDGWQSLHRFPLEFVVVDG
jgi:Xaa-Pro dipeptidase